MINIINIYKYCFHIYFFMCSMPKANALNSFTRCPGLYCGRELLPDGNWSDCGACPRGFRANATSMCISCEDGPMLYDWFYLGFVALLALLLHWVCIDIISMMRNIPKKSVSVIFVCCSRSCFCICDYFTSNRSCR